MKREEHLKRLKSLRGQERLDELIALFHDEEPRVLTDEDYRELAWPGQELTRDLYQAWFQNMAFVWPESLSREELGDWECFVAGSVKSISVEHVGARDILERLEDSLEEDRVCVLEAGGEPTQAELRDYQELMIEDEFFWSDGGDFDVVSFGCSDSEGRSIWFPVYPVYANDWPRPAEGPLPKPQGLDEWDGSEDYATMEFDNPVAST